MDKRSDDLALSTYYLQKQIMASEEMSYSYLKQNICQLGESYNRNLESTPFQWHLGSFTRSTHSKGKYTTPDGGIDLCLEHPTKD